MAGNEYESVLCVKNEVFVYQIPARTSNRGYRAADWNLDKPDWVGRMKVISKGKDLHIRLEDKNSGELFASCPVPEYPSVAVEQVTDSSRYFVIRIADGSRHAFIGLGFADRGDSFDLLVAMQDHFKWVKRDASQKADEQKAGEALKAGPKLDLGFKEGQTIRINLSTKRQGDDEGSSPSHKPRSKGQGRGMGILPPPPGGVKIMAPPRAPSAVAEAPVISAPAPAAAAPSGGLIDFGAPSGVAPTAAPLMPTLPLQPVQQTDSWGDFASAGGNQSNSQGNSWVNFE